MFLRRLSFLFAISLFFFFASCNDKDNDVSVSDIESVDTHWADSIFGSLSAQDQYYQHLIIEIPSYYQLKTDSLCKWIIDKQPGALKFIDWHPDSISIVKSTLDSSDIIQPFIHENYFEFLNLPYYPYWEANKKNRDPVYSKIFEKAGMNLLDFEIDVEMNPETAVWLDTLKNAQAIFATTAHYSDQNVKAEFNDFLINIQRFDHNVSIQLDKFDTVKFENFRKSTGFEGLFIGSSKASSINKLLSGGMDLMFKNIEVADDYANWQGATPEFDGSTKRLLLMKGKILKKTMKQHLSAEIMFTRLNLIHNSVGILQDQSKMLPFTNRFTLFSSQTLKLSQAVRKDVNVQLQTKELTVKSVESISNQSGNKVIILDTAADEKLLAKIDKIDKSKNTLICFQDPKIYDQIKNTANLMFIPDLDGESPNLLVQQLSKRLAINGNFVGADSIIKGKTIPKSIMAQAIPEFTGLDSDTLSRINWAVSQAMGGRAFPGCQVLLAKNGCIIYDKQFGHHSYQREKLVNPESMYDLASITKVVSTTLMAMKLWEMGKFDLNDSLEKFLPDSLRHHIPYPSTIRNITFHELLIHESGLPAGFPYINFINYKSEMVGRFDKFYCDLADTVYTIEVAENFFMEKEYEDSLWLRLNQIFLDKSKPYKYSDVSMNTMYYMLKSIIQNNPRDFGFTEPLKDLKDKNLYVEFLYKTFYKPLGMEHTRYKPLRHYRADQIVPTENDAYWRKQMLQGHVHDPNAALMGGIAGNAGIFSTTHDLAILCQMWLDKGVYNGQRYLKAETVEKFTSAAEGSSRGLGFNKRTISTTGFGMADSSSISTYGHTGFTGTCFWIDPDEDLVYIFLSNRVHPTVNNRIYQYGIRKRIHNAAYEARLNY